MSRLPRSRYAKLRSSAVAALLALAASVAAPHSAQAVVTLSGGGLVLAEQGGTFAANNLAASSFGAVPFGSSELGPQIGVQFHVIANLNDGLYANGNAWIGGNPPIPYPAPFAGIALDGAYTLGSIAFGRDNAGGFPTDRWQGLYTLQYTTADSVSANTPDASWTTIGTLNYGAAGGANYSAPSLRHRYNFDPVNGVTGIRLLVPATGIGNNGTAIDEIELYTEAGIVVPPPPPFTITSAAGHSITWDGNDGDHFDAAPPPAGARAPNNLALASNGAIPFGSSQYDAGVHFITNVNDGHYGNANSWLPLDSDNVAPSVGVALDGLFNVTQIAFGRDNGNGAFDGTAPGTDCCTGQLPDRWQGTHSLQYTQVANPGTTTPHTGDPTTGWADIGTVNYISTVTDGPGGEFTATLRHEFDVSANGQPLIASGIRMVVPAFTAIDELEVYGSPVPEPSTYAMIATALCGLAVVRRRRR